MSKMNSLLTEKKIFNLIPIGLFLVDQKHTIHAWNDWLVDRTNISAESAIGKSLKILFPDYHNQRFDWALHEVFEYGSPQVLSAHLNHYVIPIRTNQCTYPELDMMEQQVEIVPFEMHHDRLALVIIKDVSFVSILKNTLVSMAAKFEKNSFIDPLTKVFNQRFLWRFLEAELTAVLRQQHNIFCCLYDLDNFKEINDKLGHNAGNSVLISFSRIAKSLLRPVDYFFRYGGDEFISIHSESTETNVIKIANRIRKKLESTTKHMDVHTTITCTIGIAYCKPTDNSITAKNLINKADRELYKAKNMGRNCIVIDGKCVK